MVLGLIKQNKENSIKLIAIGEKFPAKIAIFDAIFHECYQLHVIEYFAFSKVGKV